MNIKPWSCQVELTEGCPRLCKWCGVWAIWEKPENRILKFMQVDLAQKIASDLGSWLPKLRVEFALQGEPLFNPNAVEIVRVFRTSFPKSQLLINTNGDPLRKEDGIDTDRILALFDAGLNCLLVDIYDGEGSYNWFNDKLRGSNVSVKDFYSEGGNVYTYKGYKHKEIVLLDSIAVRSGESKRRVLNNQAGNANPEFAKELGISILNTPIQRRCSNVFRELVVKYDGTVTACCFSEDTVVPCMVKSKNYINPQVYYKSFSSLFQYVDGNGAIEWIASLHNNMWRKSKILRVPCKEFYDIVVDNGIRIRATSNHKFLIKSSEGTKRIKTTIELENGDSLPFTKTVMEGKLGTFDLGRFIGLYVAEGSGFSTFYFGLKEEGYIEFVKRFAEENLGSEVNVEYQKDRNTAVVGINGSAVVGLLREYVVGIHSWDKKLTKKCFGMSKEFRAGLYEGIFQGDGGLVNGEPRGLQMANPRLVKQVCEIMASLALPYSYRDFVESDDRKPSSGIWVHQTTRKFKRDDDYLWCNINEVVNVENKKNTYYAYCFSVEGEDKFFQLSNGFVVHNCMDARRQLIVGKFPEQTLKGIWESYVYDCVRQILYNKRRDLLSPCDKCDYKGYKVGLVPNPGIAVSEDEMKKVVDATIREYENYSYASGKTHMPLAVGGCHSYEKRGA